MTQQRPQVVSIGRFAGGSFRRPGNPSKLYEYFATDHDMSGAAGNVSAVVAFRTREEAEVRAEEILRGRRAEADPRRREASLDESRERAGREVAAALSRHLRRPVGRVSWSDVLVPDARLSPACLAAMRHHPGHRYDAREGGVLYRVVLHPAAGSVVVPLEVLA